MQQKLKIYTNVNVSTQKQLFEFISTKAFEEKIVKQADDFLKALYEREKVGTTGLENHIAIPHAISDKILNQFVFVITLQKPIKYETLDGSDVRSVICLAIPKAIQHLHIDTLQKVSIMLLDKTNQDILNAGNKTKITTLFKDIKTQLEAKKTVSKKTDSKPLVNSDDTEVKPKDIENLVLLKHAAKADYEKTQSQAAANSIKEIDQRITNNKHQINVLRKDLRKNQQAIKQTYETELHKVKNKITTEKEKSKSILKAFNEKDKAAIDKIKKQSADENQKRKLLGEHFTSSYEEKLSITKKLTDLHAEKDALISNYKLNKKNTTTDFTNQMNFNKQQIINPKNWFYKYINKFQLALMILLAVFGLWGIVLGSFGTTINADFITLSNAQVASIFDSLFGSQSADYNELFLVWTKQAIQTDKNALSLCSLIFGILAIALVIPLKLFKVSNVYWEKYGMITFATSVVFLFVVLIVAALSFENIQLYDTAAKFATGKTAVEGLNTQLKAFNDLNSVLKTEADFNSINDFNSYKWNMEVLLKNWTGSDVFDESNRMLALNNAGSAIIKTMNTLKPLTFGNNDLVSQFATILLHI